MSDVPHEWVPVATIYQRTDGDEHERYHLVLLPGAQGRFPSGVYADVLAMHLLADALAEVTAEMWTAAKRLMEREEQQADKRVEEVLERAGQGT